MAVLKDRWTTPPTSATAGGWEYLQFETATRITGWDEVELIDKVIQHRTWKGLLPVEREAVRLDIERQICLGLGPDKCKAEKGEDWHPIIDQARVITSEKIISASKAVFAWLEGGGKFVDKKESERRADICRRCKLNHQPGSCSCSPLYVLIESLVPKERREPHVFVCGVCGCALTAKIVLPENALEASEEGRDLHFPSWCWRHRAT
jgi:hypothetical protein